MDHLCSFMILQPLLGRGMQVPLAHGTSEYHRGSAFTCWKVRSWGTASPRTQDGDCSLREQGRGSPFLRIAEITSILFLLSVVTRIHAASATPSTTAQPASPVARRSSEPQLCPGSAPKPPGESDKGPHASPSHTLCKASPSPSLSSYSDPDSGHYCQLQPPVRGSREWAVGETPRKARSSGERQKELSENGGSEGEWGKTFTVPVVEATSSFNLATFQSKLIPKENRPLEVGLLRKVKELLSEVDARTLARHVTKVDCLVGIRNVRDKCLQLLALVSRVKMVRG